MMPLRLSPRVLFRSLKMIALLTAVFATVDTARAINLSIGGPEIIYTKKQRSSAGGSYWPDGNFGVVSNGDGTYDFYAANGPKPVVSTGTLLKPGDNDRSVSIVNVPKKKYDYIAGGPVYEDPWSGARLMIYHAEVHQKNQQQFYSVLGMAISTDPAGRTFTDLGEIIRPNVPPGVAEVGGGSFAIVNGYLNVYYRDWLSDYSTAEVAVARAPMADIMNNALAGVGTSFSKYYNGSFSQPGLGGKSSYLENGNPNNGWLSVSYNEYLGQMMMVTSQWSASGNDLYLATSPDGINWSPRQPIALDAGEQFYPTIVGTGSQPMRTDKSFYVYYTDSNKGAWDRWDDAQLRRREITIDEPGPNIYGLGSSMGYVADWVDVADYQTDFQGGTPATGWTYAWNRKGKLGKSSDYVKLSWSPSMQIYNTTGGDLMLPDGKKTHNDDFLFLGPDRGHPGNKNYMPIIGYTVQEDDGAGYYRLANTSIQKVDGLQLGAEDGLGVLVYVNNTKMTNGYSVSANGDMASFDQWLGKLNVGDTVWVMIDPLKNQFYDSFVNFDFSLQKLIYSFQNPSQGMFPPTAVIPEPGSAVLVAIGLAALCGHRRSRRQRSE